VDASLMLAGFLEEVARRFNHSNSRRLNDR
jgi:hypothetical protein